MAMMALGIALSLLRPWPTKLLVDQVLDGRPLPAPVQRLFAILPGNHDQRGLLLWVVISTVGIFAADTLVGTLNSVASVKLGQRMTYQVGADVFRHLQRLSLVFHARRPVGDSLARVTGDTYCVQSLVIGAALPLLQSVVTLVSMFAIMWQLQTKMTLLAIAVVPFLVINIRMFSQPMKRRSRARRDLEADMMSMVEQSLAALPVVQAFDRAEDSHRAFTRYADQTVRAYTRTTLTQMWFKLVVGLSTTLGTAAVMYLGGRLALDGKITTGTILIFLSYLAMLYGPLNSITQTASSLQALTANADRVTEVLDTPVDVADGPSATDLPAIGPVRYERVSFGYERGVAVLEDVTFTAMPGQVVAIVGPTGAGKTTIVSLLIRFFDPWSGRITVGGRDLREFTLSSLRRQVAIVLQDAYLFPISVAANIAYGRPDASREEIVAAAVAADAHDFITRLPAGYDTVLGQRGTTLSGGEKQRLSLARAFLKDAPLLILDEPTSAVDSRTETSLLVALERLMAGRITFVIAHRLSTIRKADTVLVVDRGRIVERGRAPDLADAGGLYAELYRPQGDFLRHDESAARGAGG